MPSLQSPAEPVFQADPENVTYVPQIASHQVQTTIGVVAPANRYLLDAIAEPPRDRENLHIEHVCVDLLPAEQFLRHIVPEEFEAALGVVDAGESDYRLHEPEKTLRAKATVKWLGALDGDALASPGADGDIRAAREDWAKVVEFLDGDLIVRIGVSDDCTCRECYGVTDSKALAAPLLVADSGKRWVGLRHLTDDFARAVIAVGRYDDLIRQAAGVEVANSFADGCRDDTGLVVRRQ